MYEIGESIDGKYVVVGVCENQGGMGTVLFVKDKSGKEQALKYCEKTEYYDRFRREIRLVKKYIDNSKVVTILDSSLESTPPYFVMPKAEKGNLYNIITEIQNDSGLQESVFFRMIDCLDELHKNGDIHRDIKPENFLIYKKDRIVISDLGLPKQPDSSTRCTLTMQQGGTEEFAPPEFFTEGGFKHAGPEWDIHSLGKSFYRLLTGRDARLITGDGINPSLFYIIEKCSKNNPRDRYQTAADLKQGLKSAFDIIHQRIDTHSKYHDLLSKIEDHLEENSKYSGSQVLELLDLLSGMDTGERHEALRFFPNRIIRAMANNEKFSDKLTTFISLYKEMFDGGNDFGFSYAETIAKDMKIIFSGSATNENKTLALSFAIHAAVSLNRFAAMGTCKDMIRSVNSDELAMRVADVIRDSGVDSFVSDIEASSCKHHLIKRALKELGNELE